MAFATLLLTSTASGQTLRVYQAEWSGYNTGRPYTDWPISGIYAGWAFHPPGLIHHVGGIAGLPANRDLNAKFRLSKVSTVIGTNSVALEVFSETRQRTLAHRVLKNRSGDGSQGYLDHHIKFRVNPGEVVSLRVYFYSSRGSQVKFDLSYIEQ
jgi:hypothetical protein